MSNLVQVKSLVQMARGTSAAYHAMSTPVPANVVLFSVDDGAFKLGDGVSEYSVLPVLFTFNELVAAQGGLSALFKTPTAGDQGKVVVVAMNQETGVLEYRPSDVTLSSILSAIDALEDTNAAQDVAVAQLLSAALSIDASIGTAADGNLVVINQGRYSDGGQSISSIQAQVEAEVSHIPGSHIEEPIFFSDSGKQNVVDKMSLVDNATYYVEVVGFNNTVPNPVFGLTTGNAAVQVTHVDGNLFAVKYEGVVGTKPEVPVILTMSVDDGSGNATIRKAVATVVKATPIMLALMGGTGYDRFYSVTTDSSNNIICAGRTSSEGPGAGDRCLVVKFDSSLGIVARKVMGGNGGEVFRFGTVDSSDNIICVGYTDSEGPGAGYRCLIVKFDSSLNILTRKVMGGTGHEIFNAVVTDSADNIICTNYTYSEGPGSDRRCLVVKFDSTLNIIARKVMGGTGVDAFSSVKVDSSDNIICVGSTDSEGPGAGYRCLIVKFDPSLNIISQKVMGGSGTDVFHRVTVDSSNNIICVGYTSSEGPGANQRCLVVKFNSSLNILARKVMGGSGGDYFWEPVVDSANNIICIGRTTSEGPGANQRCLVVKFDPSLNIISQKVMGGSGDDALFAVTTDSFNNIICVGATTSEGPGASDRCLVVKFPSDIPVGSFVGTLFPGMALEDGTLAIADSTMDIADSTLDIADSTLDMVDSGLSMADSTLTYGLEPLN